MKRLLALLAALTVLLALAGCGASGGTGDDQEDPAQMEETLPEEENTGDEAETPQEPETEDPAEEEAPAEQDADTAEENSQKAPAETGMTLSRTDFTLFKAGSTYKLTASGAKEACTYTSSDPKVATVGKDGTVTAVAPARPSSRSPAERKRVPAWSAVTGRRRTSLRRNRRTSPLPLLWTSPRSITTPSPTTSSRPSRPLPGISWTPTTPA